MKKSDLILFASLVLAVQTGYADDTMTSINTGNMPPAAPPVMQSASPDKALQQQTQTAIQHSNTHSEQGINDAKTQERMGRRMESPSMSNGMNSSMGAR